MTHLPFITQPYGDVLAETSHLSTEEFGAYQLLAFSFWQHGALPNDDNRLARIARASPEVWATMREPLQELFGIDWQPERLSARRIEVETIHLKKSAGGKKGSTNRWAGKGKPSPKDDTVNDTPNETPIKTVNGSAYDNYNYNHNSMGMEEKSSTRTHAREEFIPTPASHAEAEALLNTHNVFPCDWPPLVERLMRGELTQSELEAA
jgi:uncharacterized protein YdaU (DUF1376 family)